MWQECPENTKINVISALPQENYALTRRKKKDMKPINMINIMGLRIECTETEREQKYICQFFFQGIKVKLDLSPKAKR